ncbi:MAG: FeoB-associated Cys-rich membrane protein [Christensenellaceae bacterium]|jgi:hypothetical protein|nr:FeoB-associated Cys-rich membrane protein [Christensenellaceae bacterium]
MNLLTIISNLGAITEVLVGIGAGLLVLLSIVSAIIRKKKGKTSCGCDCPGCSGQCNSMKQLVGDEENKTHSPD